VSRETAGESGQGPPWTMPAVHRPAPRVHCEPTPCEPSPMETHARHVAGPTCDTCLGRTVQLGPYSAQLGPVQAQSGLVNVGR
jgi:hypothetical protein